MHHCYYCKCLCMSILQFRDEKTQQQGSNEEYLMSNGGEQTTSTPPSDGYFRSCYYCCVEWADLRQDMSDWFIYLPFVQIVCLRLSSSLSLSPLLPLLSLCLPEILETSVPPANKWSLPWQPRYKLEWDDADHGNSGRQPDQQPGSTPGAS